MSAESAERAREQALRVMRPFENDLKALYATNPMQWTKRDKQMALGCVAFVISELCATFPAPQKEQP